MRENISVCGMDCSVCYCFGKMCNGCNSCEGKVFHAPEGKACPIYDCVRNSKCMQNCGECSDVPCKIWFDTRDPKFSDEEFSENVTMRVQRQVRSICRTVYRNHHMKVQNLCCR